MDEDTLTVWLDTALLMLGGFVLMTILMLASVNPPAKSAAAAGIQSPGNVIVEAHWANDLDADVDLWVEAPGDRPVGYSNMSGRYFNLLRDDLGKRNDPTDLNYEVAYSRSAPPGQYVVNVHMYRAGAGVHFPVKVKLVATLQRNAHSPAEKLAAATVELRRLNDEITAFRFTLDGKHNLVPGSVNNLFDELRTARK
jgi:hypothetical protein